ncbi:YTH domain-containing family protein 3-like [Carica papaya]|uniref:YTH domain-containing family protein 3-like n=1 Tax=Carica papaya TaxID=3649 RepID=UPI000B8CA559|nr:YTH domain-containing family protein 3-like [Carica papaya]
MEMYNVSGQGNGENHLIQGAGSNLPSTNPPLFEQVKAMYNEGAPDFVVDQGLYYPNSTNYGYYCTGLESPGEWEDHQRIFGADGPDTQYMGAQTETLPYVYYTPNYGYAQSPYNPYNPYIPGAMVGVDGSLVGTQQYYPVPPYQNNLSSPAYIPFIGQPDVISNNSDPLFEIGAAAANRQDGRGFKNNLASASTAFPRNPPKPVMSQTHSLSWASEGPRANSGPSKQQGVRGGVSYGGFPYPASTHVFQAPVDKQRPKIYGGGALKDVNGSADALGEQNRGPRTNRSKNQLIVKAYTTKSGEGDAQGNIVINADQYNRDDFSLDYVDAKFFVIKSYSEDDVHKSIKYNVWSSTPHGNKKLQSAYEDAEKFAIGKPAGCPIFLFFSVNASGQFCGVAEMVGPVDFHKDMHFWQQDKWSGSFPVKWHFIKDVPNTNFRHIILENNENKPVTNSRDTQEIMYEQGQEMMKIFKDHRAKTSLLDDFIYYENRQKLMQEEKARLVYKSLRSPFLVSELESANKLKYVVEPPPNNERLVGKAYNFNSSRDSMASPEKAANLNSNVINTNNTNEKVEQIAGEVKDDAASSLRIGFLTIKPRNAEPKTVADVAVTGDTEPSSSVVTVGSMPVKVNGFAAGPSNSLTVGTIPLDPRSLQPKTGT